MYAKDARHRVRLNHVAIDADPLCVLACPNATRIVDRIHATLYSRKVERFVFHHVGIAVRDLKTSVPAYKNLLGYDLVSGPFDDPLQRVSVSFLSRGLGDPVLELVAPMTPDSPIARVLKAGGGPYHICYQVPDIMAAIEHLRKNGSLLVSEPLPAVAFDMKEIAWMMTDEANLLIELLQL